jgi:hypothetical protein
MSRIRKRSILPVGHIYSWVIYQSLTYSASYVTVPSVLPAEVMHPLIPVEELTHLSSSKSMLPAALSEALGICLSEVMDRYYSGSDEVARVCLIEDALDRRRTIEEGEEWLAKEARKFDIIAEQINHGGSDDSF